MKRIPRQRGYTLLFAVLTAVLVLGVAVFIVSISRKQLILSSTAQNSMFSLYSADSAIECVAADKDAVSSSSQQHPSALDCDGQSVTPSFSRVSYTDPVGNLHPDAYQSSFDLGFSYTDPSGNTGAPGSNGCADVTVTQYYDAVNIGTLDTVVAARGYNFCNPSTVLPPLVPFTPDTSNPQTVERALQLSF